MKGRQGVNGHNQGGGNAAPTIRPHQMTPQELHEAQSPQDQFSPDINENTSGDRGKCIKKFLKNVYKKKRKKKLNIPAFTVWGNRQTLNNVNKKNNGEMDITDETDPLSRNHAQRNQQSAQPSAWDKIRSENLPNNTWSKIRMEAQKNPDSSVEIEKAKSARANRLRENSDFGNGGEREMPRTREEALERGSSRKNQWGDPLE